MRDALQWMNETLSPVAFVAIGDGERRHEVANGLRDDGWAVVESKTGYHLVESLSDLILADRPWVQPHLIVADVHAPGCSGITISQGLRELGWSTPIILLSNQGVIPIHNSTDEQCIVVDGAASASLIRAVAAAFRRSTRKEVQGLHVFHPSEPRLHA